MQIGSPSGDERHSRRFADRSGVKANNRYFGVTNRSSVGAGILPPQTLARPNPTSSPIISITFHASAGGAGCIGQGASDTLPVVLPKTPSNSGSACGVAVQSGWRVDTVQANDSIEIAAKAMANNAGPVSIAGHLMKMQRATLPAAPHGRQARIELQMSGRSIAHPWWLRSSSGCRPG